MLSVAGHRASARHALWAELSDKEAVLSHRSLANCYMLLRTGVKLLLVSPARSFGVSFSTDKPPDPVNSPMFDGSAYSMSGNGVYEAHNCTNALPTGLNCIPPGQGGGCVTTGPFKKCVSISDLSACTNKPDSMSVNLGPVSPTLAEPEVMASASWPGSAYNPRCLKRDVSQWVSSQVRRETVTSRPYITDKPSAVDN